MVLELRAQFRKREALCIVHKDHTMGIAHRDAGHAILLAVHDNRLRDNLLRTEARYGDFLPFEHRHAHIHLDRRYNIVLRDHARHHRPRQRLNRELLRFHTPIVIEIPCETANAVPAHLRLRPVGIELAHPHIRRLRGADHHQTVCTDAEMPIAHLHRECRKVNRLFIQEVHDHKIVAAALPFCKLHLSHRLAARIVL